MSRKTARKAGIPTLIAFFGPETAKEVVAERGHADLIVANNVLAQVPELNDFVAGMAYLLAPEGVITIEVPHLERLIDENQFDTIYHEHFSYFSLGTMSRLAAAHGLVLIDVETLPTHGGSLRVYLAHRGSRHPVSIRVADMLAQERRGGLETIAAYSILPAGFSAPSTSSSPSSSRPRRRESASAAMARRAKGNTLLNYAGIGTDFLDFTVDRNPYKHGRYTPGMHIPILPVEAIDDGQAGLHSDPALEPQG